jgi:hypothetical protein
MSLGIVNYGELFQLDVANKCNGYIGEVVAGMANPSHKLVYPLPDIMPYYVLAFLEQLPSCAWSQMRRCASGGGLYRPQHPHGATIYYYYVDALVLRRVSVNVVEKEVSAGGDDPQLEAIFKRQREEEAQQLEAAKASRDRIFAEIFKKG